MKTMDVVEIDLSGIMFNSQEWTRQNLWCLSHSIKHMVC